MSPFSSQISDCRVIDTQISREDGGKDTVTQMILASGDYTNVDYIANVNSVHSFFHGNLILVSPRFLYLGGYNLKNQLCVCVFPFAFLPF